MAESARKEHTLSMPDWSHLPEELLNIISKNLDNCFDVVHARSVCRSWRSKFPFPACLSRQSYSLPTFVKYHLKDDEDLCTLEKIPLFVFKVHNPTSSVSEYLLGGIVRDEPGDNVEQPPSPLQCSLNLKMPYTNLINVLECQILSLGHQYRIKHSTISRDFQGPISAYGGVASLPLKKEGGEDFMVLLNDIEGLMMLTSAEMRWRRLKNVPSVTCMDLVTFKGKFYATFLSMQTFVIDPYTLDVTPLMPLQHEISSNYLVRCGDDELFLVDLIYPISDVFDPKLFTCRVSRLDEEAGRWVEVRVLGDRVFFIGYRGNFSCLAKDLCDGRVSGNSVLFINMCMDVAFFFIYGLHMGTVEEDVESYLSVAIENCVTIVYNTYPVLALLVE